jgi:malic enzyme
MGLLQDFVADKSTLAETVASFQPKILIGATGVSGLFSEQVVKEMAKCHKVLFDYFAQEELHGC